MCVCVCVCVCLYSNEVLLFLLKFFAKLPKMYHNGIYVCHYDFNWD